MLISRIVMSTINILFIVVGGVSMVITTYRYHRLLRSFRKATYTKYTINYIQQNLSIVLLYIFIAAFIVGIVDTMLHDTAPMYTFITAIFLLGAFFIFFIVNILRNMEKMLRVKNMEIMKTFVNSIELKDSYTKGHSLHVYNVVEIFYNHLGDSYKKQLNLPKLMDAAMLHDIGKICIKDDILNKRNKLTQEDWDVIKRHPLEAKKMLDDTCFSEISDWVFYHHERMDGRGYYALSADKIPLESKIIAIADTYSALCTNRAYRSRMSHKEAVAILKEASGDQFDEDLLKYFFEIPEEELARLLIPVAGINE